MLSFDGDADNSVAVMDKCSIHHTGERWWWGGGGRNERERDEDGVRGREGRGKGSSWNIFLPPYSPNRLQPY